MFSKSNLHWQKVRQLLLRSGTGLQGLTDGTRELSRVTEIVSFLIVLADTWLCFFVNAHQNVHLHWLYTNYFMKKWTLKILKKCLQKDIRCHHEKGLGEDVWGLMLPSNRHPVYIVRSQGIFHGWMCSVALKLWEWLDQVVFSKVCPRTTRWWD